MQKNILITGASGFIGSYLVDAALKKNYRTVAGIRSTSSKKYLTNPDIHFLDMDFNSEKSLDLAIQTFVSNFGKIDFVIHNAGVTRAKKNEDYDRVNFENTQRLVNALQRNQQVPEKFVLISSLAAYGPAENDVSVISSQEKKPLTAYGRSKLKAESVLFNTTNFPFVIINPTAVYGPKDKDVFFLIQSIHKGFEVYIGHKKQLLSFVHVEDLCAAIFIAMESTALNQQFLVSDLQVYTSAEFNQQIKSILNKKTLSIVMPVWLVKSIASVAETIGKLTGNVQILNQERLKEFVAPDWSVNSSDIVALGYQPKYNLEAGLTQTIEWYQQEKWLK
jgi:UDP-glucose 4-epimerase